MSRISIQMSECREDGVKTYSVLFDRRTAIANFYDDQWAKCFADVVEALVPANFGHDTALRAVHDGLLSLVHTRFLVAGVLERAAELQQARALESLDDAERSACAVRVEALRAEVRRLLSPRSTDV